MPFRKRIFIAVLLAISALLSGAALAGIRDLRPVFRPLQMPDGKLIIAIRAFKDGGKEKLLAVDPVDFETSLVDNSGLKEVQDERWRDTPYMKALLRFTSRDEERLNRGIKAAQGVVDGVFLTVDMCPSKKKFDRDLFESAAAMAGKDKPVPVAIAISGLWAERHNDELEWILGLESSGKIDITWVNHSYSHPYDGGARKSDEDFLLKPGVDFEGEILKEEAVLLNRGLLPSPFFRFPGLVSNGELLDKLRSLSLIPIGANAWLAKGEKPEAGSIILVHGNGNEPAGVKKLIGILEKAGTKEGGLKLKPLKDAFSK